MSAPILSARGLKKSYGGVRALRGMDIDLAEGEIHGLCGENGAGKSTLVKILGGFVMPDEGELGIGGMRVTLGTPVDPALLSIVHQELSIIPHLSVLDNVMLGAREVGALYRRGPFRAHVREVLDSVGLAHVPLDALADTLPLAERQLIEIARGIARGARVLLLDEPTATLSDGEIEKVFAVLRRLKAEKGTTIVIISHRLNEIFALTDRVTVLRSGQHVMTANTADLTNARLVEAMIGHEIHTGEIAPSHARNGVSPRLSLRGWTLPGRFAPLDLDVQPGQIVSLVGQLGSGADTLLESLVGLHPARGTLSLDGAASTPRTVAEAYAAGIAYVSEDRAKRGVFLEAPIGTNLVSQILGRVSRRGWMMPATVRARAAELARGFALDPARLPHDVSTLSGGNQQKVSLGKAAALGPRLLALNEPTRGVDIGARAEIYDQLRSLAKAEGLTILFYSTDLEEVLDASDRIVTFYRGTRVRDALRPDMDADAILHDILHGPDTPDTEAAA
ncbi:sugar ABC transporter ATP-binding protein [Pseudooceanicola nanhaiensis]|uniref:sugar ABC transporter ATP-binding protein n=1 Tax=Pseudooceanicola nanhaiensis TaxID=375761 RepID=UPI001CD6A320|nr:sugar ABC transporter ATP-binding protein [Pseudooceanicola nanhaiensis]MCA0921443.1 sugar ABC transporter ATP-binding protein [Pseudooceanicola nanhaiensis]